MILIRANNEWEWNATLIHDVAVRGSLCVSPIISLWACFRQTQRMASPNERYKHCSDPAELFIETIVIGIRMMIYVSLTSDHPYLINVYHCYVEREIDDIRDCGACPRINVETKASRRGKWNACRYWCSWVIKRGTRLSNHRAQI